MAYNQRSLDTAGEFNQYQCHGNIGIAACAEASRRPAMKTTGQACSWHSLVLALAITSVQAQAGAPESEAELKNFVIQDCGSCHGLKLKGGLGPPLRPADIEALPEAAISAIIREGVPGTAMPPWKALLTDQQIAWISEQLKSGALIAPESDSPRSR